jgi:hypothetical protein
MAEGKSVRCWMEEADGRGGCLLSSQWRSVHCWLDPSCISRSDVPITPNVIAIVSNTATREKQPEGLKMTTHSGHVLFDSSWIAGVDYDEQFVQEATIEYK